MILIGVEVDREKGEEGRMKVKETRSFSKSKGTKPGECLGKNRSLKLLTYLHTL